MSRFLIEITETGTLFNGPALQVLTEEEVTHIEKIRRKFTRIEKCEKKKEMKSLLLQQS